MRREYSAGIILYSEQLIDKVSTRLYLLLYYPKGYWDLAKGHMFLCIALSVQLLVPIIWYASVPVAAWKSAFLAGIALLPGGVLFILRSRKTLAVEAALWALSFYLLGLMVTMPRFFA